MLGCGEGKGEMWEEVGVWESAGRGVGVGEGRCRECWEKCGKVCWDVGR